MKNDLFLKAMVAVIAIALSVLVIQNTDLVNTATADKTEKEAYQEGFIGEIKMFGGNFAPRSWALCEGQLLAISQNQALFSILGTTYGGDGRTTFALPDLRGRTAIGPGNGPGLSSRQLGAKGGVERVTLSASQMPSHNHGASGTIKVSERVGGLDAPKNAVFSKTDGAKTYGNLRTNTTMANDILDVKTQNTGGSQAHENMMPYTAVNYIICLQGTFPSRN